MITHTAQIRGQPVRDGSRLIGAMDPLSFVRKPPPAPAGHADLGKRATASRWDPQIMGTRQVF
jgi:hypothetical protein